MPGGGYGKVVIHADYTHSFIGALFLSAAFGALAWWRWDRRLGLLLGAVAFSHWVLDLIVHRGDMPILPGNAGSFPLLGFGLWRVPVASILLEAALLLLGVFLYWRAARSTQPRPGSRVTPNLVTGALLASGVIVLVLDARDADRLSSQPSKEPLGRLPPLCLSSQPSKRPTRRPQLEPAARYHWARSLR